VTESLPEVALTQRRFAGNNVAEARANGAKSKAADIQYMNKQFSAHSAYAH
jgi:hypothetical protein